MQNWEENSWMPEWRGYMDEKNTEQQMEVQCVLVFLNLPYFEKYGEQGFSQP